MTSWIDSANDPGTHFPLQNLPYGVFSEAKTPRRCGVAIGDLVLDLAVLHEAGLLTIDDTKTPDTQPARLAPSNIFAQPALNDFMALGPKVWQLVRDQLTLLLRADGTPILRDNQELCRRALRPRDQLSLHLPFKVSEYTDFYASRHHAFNVGTLFRGPENALPPNWLHMPIGYNGRASTVVASGTSIRRPIGQLKLPDADQPSFGPCQSLDFELELGAVIGVPNNMGERVSVAAADDMIFGYVLLNDWSARDIQAWEYQPLGPFQAKAFATSISPWVVSKTALAPFRKSTPAREKPLLDYLLEPGPLLYDLQLQVLMHPNSSAAESTTISRTNYKYMYYSAAQQLAHHTSSGCKMNIGDLLGSGTISGPDPDQLGSLLEMTLGGKQSIELANNVPRTFIEDGDVVTLTGWAQGDGHRIGFGECTGTILPAHGP